VSTAVPAPCDGAQAEAEEGGSARHPNWTLAATMLASSLAFIDGSVTNVALPAIGHDLANGAVQLPWVINAYLLPLSALILLGGAAGDLYGRRRMLIAGMALFSVASLGCALAPSFPLLLAARAVQGIGAAILMPNSLGILGSSFSGEARGRAVGTWAAAGAIASAIGPPFGGWLVDAISWRAIFYVNLPVAGAAMLIARRYIEESAESSDPLDWLGAALATLGLGALTWALTVWSSHHTASVMTWLGTGAGVALMLAFLYAEHRRGERAMMPLSLFGSVPFVGLTLLTFLLYAALGGLLMLLPYLLIVGGGYRPLQAGFALLPFSIVMGTASRFTGTLTAKVGARWLLTLGPVATGLGFALLHGVDPQGSYWRSVFPGMALVALGMAGTAAPLTTAVLSSVDDRHEGTASGFNSAIARTGGLIATALAGAVIAAAGTHLVAAFRSAAIVAAVAAAASGLVAFLTLDHAPRSAG
jgi:EmrB/QacA subfamily drug resistance transporter